MTEKEYEIVIDLVSTHHDHNGGFCDTGGDMEWQCRAECVQIAIDRLNQYFNEEYFKKIKESERFNKDFAIHDATSRLQ